MPKAGNQKYLPRGERTGGGLVDLRCWSHRLAFIVDFALGEGSWTGCDVCEMEACALWGYVLRHACAVGKSTQGSRYQESSGVISVCL